MEPNITNIIKMAQESYPLTCKLTMREPTADGFKLYCAMRELDGRSVCANSKLELFPIIREYYDLMTPIILKNRAKNLGTLPYGIDFFRFSSPIEQTLWNYIRSAGLPFYPEYPVLNYFIDFADPYLKIGLEADGKHWHDKEKDAKRDKRLSECGWIIYRIPGYKIERTIKIDEDEIAEAYYDEIVYDSDLNFILFRRNYLDQKISYTTEYCGGILEVIAEKHLGRQIICR